MASREADDAWMLGYYKNRAADWRAEKRVSGKIALGCLAVAAADAAFLPLTLDSPVIDGVLVVTGLLGAAFGMRWAIAASTVSEYQADIDRIESTE